MEIRSTLAIFLLLFSALLAASSPGVAAEANDGEPLEAQCRPYIEEALKKLETGETPPDSEIVDAPVDESRAIEEPIESQNDSAQTEDAPVSAEQNTNEDEATSQESETTVDDQTKGDVSMEESTDTENGEKSDEKQSDETTDQDASSSEKVAEDESQGEGSSEAISAEKVEELSETDKSAEALIGSSEITQDAVQSEENVSEQDNKSEEQVQPAEDASREVNSEVKPEVSEEQTSAEQTDTVSGEAGEETSSEKDEIAFQQQESSEDVKSPEELTDNVSAEQQSAEQGESEEKEDEEQSTEQKTETSSEVQDGDSREQIETSTEAVDGSTEQDKSAEKQEDGKSKEVKDGESQEETENMSQEEVEKKENEAESQEQKQIIEESKEQVDATSQEQEQSEEKPAVSGEQADLSAEKVDSGEQPQDASTEQVDAPAEDDGIKGEVQPAQELEAEVAAESAEPASSEVADTQSDETNATSEPLPEEDLMQAFDIPTNLRSRSHISQILHLDDESNQVEKVITKASDVILKELKRIYEGAIKPLETLYKYRDLSNRHFGDPEIFSKPLVLFMGPWSGGKSSIINYLLDNEYSATSLRTGAEPSPAYFNILMWGEKPEMLDGTQLAADWTFSGLQKFGQGLEERLSGLKLPSKLLEKVNIVEIPGILEVRKQVSRVFPFNDACQWFIDRADIIFLVYDPSKLDVGPETEAILDQLKGREYQTRILLNKADQVKSEELMRVQGALIWNISPLMSSAQPPVMYLTSLWSRPYEEGAPVRLLQAQERAFLRDIKAAVDKRIENKISSARRFAVRVRNHAKMVDCYLTTYYNHKSVFANKKLVSDQIIEHPQDYHIYEGLSTLTNISRYDLPDPDVYRDFFRLNPLYEFQQLSATCTYFRGCPINRLDVAIAYDFPELVGKYKKMVEQAISNIS